MFAAVAIFATVGARAEEEEGRKWLSLHAFADVESAYICRGYIWNVRPYSAQFVDGEIGLFAFVGQFCLVSDDARDAAKATKTPEARRDLTFGGVGVSFDF